MSMSLKKSIRKLLRNPAEMRIDEVSNILIYLGFTLDRIKGSHYTFIREGRPASTLPCHNQKVKRYYLRKIYREYIAQLLVYEE